ncbi:MAG: L-lactate permease [Chloroflexaceae bacterium]|nr:L-lactate permease [Chloroflexaceae bacterium]
MTWTQVYTPLGSLLLSALVAALPIVVLLGLLGVFHVKAHIAALAGLASALLIAIFVYGMPWQLGLAAAVNGAFYGLFPIGWIILGAIFIYDISVKTGKFEIVKQSIAGLASDRRIQVLLIAFAFGAFIEGAAGFGTPVAISAAMLIGLGFAPLPAAGLALIGNTAPVAYGALGTPIIVLSSVTGLDLMHLSAMAGRQLPFFSLLVPFWIVWAMAGRKKMWEVWPACLTAGLSFAVSQFLVSNFHGPWLVDIISALVSMASLVVLLRFWQPKTTFRFPGEDDGERRPLPAMPRPAGSAGFGDAAMLPRPAVRQLSRRRQVLIAWMPWIILSLLVFLWGTPQVKTFLNGGTKDAPNFLSGITVQKVPVPYLDKAVYRDVPVVPKPEAEPAVYTFNWLSATGTSLLIAGVLSGLLLGLSPLALARIFAGTLWRIRISLLTIAAMLALGYTTRYGGLDATMGLAFASTGALFAFFSPLLGWLGVALTGSDTSSNVLFGNLQQITAQQIGISPVLAAASNSSGGVMGKMIDAQSIVVASVATNQHGQEGSILRYVFLHSLVLACLVGVVVFLQAYVFTWMIP